MFLTILCIDEIVLMNGGPVTHAFPRETLTLRPHSVGHKSNFFSALARASGPTFRMNCPASGPTSSPTFPMPRLRPHLKLMNTVKADRRSLSNPKSGGCISDRCHSREQLAVRKQLGKKTAYEHITPNRCIYIANHL